MRDIYPYYERELNFMRDMAGEFGRNYPHVAARLDLERHRCEDPHVERLIEAFCLIAARIHHRLDADFPEVTQALLNLVYPHYLRPIPAMSITEVKVSQAEKGRTERIRIDAGTEIDIGDELCRFRTCYPVDVWPISVQSAAVLDAVDVPEWGRAAKPSAAILLELVAGPQFAHLQDFESLRFYLAGPGHAPYTLYELILANCDQVLIRDLESRRRPVTLTRECLQAVGFSESEGAFPYDGRSFHGLRLLHEYFAFPQKFLFFDLCRLSELRNAAFGHRIQILFALDQHVRRTEEFSSLRMTASADNFLMSCTPVVNLFPWVAEQIHLDQTKADYQVIPDNDRNRSLEVYSVDSVVGRKRGTWDTRSYRPFFSFGHLPSDSADLFWQTTRRPSIKTSGTEVFLSVVDPEFRPAEPADEVLDLRVTCTNRDLPSKLVLPLTFGEIAWGDHRLESRMVHRPTKTLSPPVDRDLDWRVISMLGLNYLSLVCEEHPGTRSNADALRELLSLYNFSEDAAIGNRIRSISRVGSYPTRARITMERGGERVPVFCHGTAVDLEVDADGFGGSGPFLLVSILEQFFAFYNSINSFSRLTATVNAAEPRGRAVWRWPTRNGERALL